jgi:hypothetical protein
MTPAVPSAPSPSGRLLEKKTEKVSLSLKKNLLFAAVLVAGVAFVFILRSPVQKSPDVAQEIPFDAVVKESEATVYKPDTTRRAFVPPAPVQPDSLKLEIQTSDSVWISILVDGKTTQEYLFPPNRKRTFAAKDQFSITMGNAGGATFRLNGKEMGSLGRRGSVVRNIVINQARLKTLSTG